MVASTPMLADDDLEIPEELNGAFAVLRRGIRESPELRKGLWFTVVVSLGVTVSTLVTPILIEQVFDEGFDPEFRPRVRVRSLRWPPSSWSRSRSSRRGRRPAGSSSRRELALQEPPRADVPPHPPPVDRRAVRGEARGVRRAGDRRRRRAAEVHGVGRDRLDHLGRSRRPAPSSLMLVYSWQLAIAVVLLMIPLLVIMGSMQRAALRGVQHGAHARRRDALRGLRVRDGGGGRPRLRARRATRTRGWSGRSATGTTPRSWRTSARRRSGRCRRCSTRRRCR